MLPALDRTPTTTGASKHRSFVLLLTLLACSILATGARAFDLEVGQPVHERGALQVVINLNDPLSSRVENSLSRGMPATIQYRTELWRRRTGWFQKLESSQMFDLKVSFDVWSKTYQVQRAFSEPEIYTSVDSLRKALSRPTKLPVAPMHTMRQGPRYYVVVTATLKPLTVEDVAEGEGWLSGEVEEKRQSGLGIITALPQAIFDAMRNVSGLGDQHARSVSPNFRLRDLSGLRPAR